MASKQTKKQKTQADNQDAKGKCSCKSGGQCTCGISCACSGAPCDSAAVVADQIAELNKTFMSGKTRCKTWRRTQLQNFQRMLTENKQAFLDALYADLHKSHHEGYFSEVNILEHEVQLHLDHFEEWAKPTKVPTDLVNIPGCSYIYQDPLGVCLIMGTWNYPLHLTLLPIIGCISAGNCAAIKVSAALQSPTMSALIARVVPRYLDNSAFKVFEGARDVTQALLNLKFEKIFFTGGKDFGQSVLEAAAKHITPCVLELGGKSPVLVDRSADVGVAASRIAFGALMNSGQTCVRPDYLLVHKDIADAFVDRLVKTIKQFYGEDPKQSPWFGRLVNGRAWDRVNGLIQAAKSEKCEIRLGGETDEKTKFVAPTVVDYGLDVEAFALSQIMQGEVFGPIIPILRYASLDQAIDFIRIRPKPLSSYCFTTTCSTKKRFLSEVTAGSCNINDTIMNMTNADLPFGGVGYSGMGSYHGKKSFEAFSHQKSVLVKTNYLDLPQRYPPYTPFGISLVNFIQAARPAWHFKALKYGLYLLAFLYLYMKRHDIKRAAFIRLQALVIKVVMRMSQA